MKNALHTLTRVRKFKIDEQRKLMAEQQALEERLQNELNELTACYEREKEFARLNTNLGDFGLYTKKYLQQRDELEDRLLAVRARIVQIRDIIADLFKEQKTYEIVDNDRKKKVQKEFDAKEQKMLDDIGANAYIKHNHS